MTDTQPQKSTTLTLDDLFSLKRAEMPQAGFWEQFDQQFRRRSLREFTRSSRHQSRSLWRGWGIGVCMATLLTMGIPLMLLLEDRDVDSGSLMAYAGAAESSPAREFHAVAHSPWEQVQVVDSHFVLETLNTAGVESPALNLYANLPAERFIMDTITMDTLSVRKGRTPVTF